MHFKTNTCFKILFSACAITLFSGATINLAYANARSIPLISLISPVGSQDANNYLNPNTKNQVLISNSKQEKLAKKALKKYFQPWGKHIDIANIKQQSSEDAHDYLENPQYGFNFHRNSAHWIKHLVNNMNLNAAWNAPRNAVIVNNTTLRTLPTNLPIFESSKIAGQGYPFDTLSLSALWVGEPIKVITLSKDKAWALVKDHNYFGWIKINTLAYVSPTFIKEYKAKHFVVITKDNVSVQDTQGNFITYSRIGMLFPLINNAIMMPVKQLNGSATLQATHLNSQDYAHFPLTATPAHFALLMNRMMGEPYGWGGYDELRDCSLTTQDLLFPFGILLPRNSSWQAQDGKRIMLSHLTNQEKNQFILKHGKPFLTLVHFPGHIALYIGQKNKQALIFQNKWGIHTEGKNGYDGRAVIGKADIAPLSLGKHVPHASATMLSRANSITILE